MEEVTIRLTVEEALALQALLLEAEQTEVADSILLRVEDSIEIHALTEEVSEMYAEMGL
jgi:hypothetical protein